MIANPRIFLTGGTGFFGRWMLRTLPPGARATVLTRHPGAFRSAEPELVAHTALVEGDVRTFEFPPGDFDYVLHLAADTDSRLYQEAPLEMFDTIVAGTRRTLEFAKRCGARAVLLASSGAVYGRQPPQLTHVPEEHAGAPDPLHPASVYGEAKRAAELIAGLLGAPVTIARCFAFVGPGLPLDRHFAIGNFLGDALAGRPITVRGDGTALRSYLYAEDLAHWLWTILEHGAPGRAYNVGSPEAITISDLAHTVARCVNPSCEVRVLGVPTADRPAERYVPSVERAENELGLRVRVGLEDAIRRTAAWHRSRT